MKELSHLSQFSFDILLHKLFEVFGWFAVAGWFEALQCVFLLENNQKDILLLILYLGDEFR